MTVCHVKGVSHGDEPTETLQFQLIVLVFWHTTILLWFSLNPLSLKALKKPTVHYLLSKRHSEQLAAEQNGALSS